MNEDSCLGRARPFRGRTSPLTALDIFERVLDGVAYAHQHGIIHRDLKKLFPKLNIPDPIHFVSYYTNAGTHYWTPNNASEDNYQSMLKPLDYPLYICGESYSHHQGWMEGALETAEDVLNLLQD